jgi:CBS domain-containing protein
MGSVDPIAWLRATPPFRDLPASRFARAAGTLDVAFRPAGAWLVRTGGRPLEHLFVIRKGSVRIERDGQTLQIIEEGECFGYTSLITGQANLDVQVEEDLVAYRLPAA